MIRRLVIVAAFLAACIAAVVFTGASNDQVGTTFKVEFDNAFGLTEGGDLRIGGVKAGTTESFDITDGEPPKALVTIKVAEPGFDSLRTDARCEVRQQSLIGEYYVDCQPGSEAEELAPNATIPVEQTASIIPADLVNNVLRRPYVERLRLIIGELGTGLAGRPDDLAETLRRAHPGLRQTTETLGILKGQTDVIQDFITDSDTVVEELAANKADVSRFVREAGETAEITATRKEELAEQFQKLPEFLGELEPTMVRLGQLSDAQIPLLADLRTASGDLNRFFTELGPFAEATRPALRSLGDTSITGREAINESSSEIRQLRQLARNAPGFAVPLRQFLQTADSRQRAVETDPRAADTDPPSFDPESLQNSRNNGLQAEGFTAIEGFLNYTFWQTLAINSFDDTSHFLRILGVVSEDCTDYIAQPTAEQVEKCNSYLGPRQPGVEEATGTVSNEFDSSRDLEGFDRDPTEGGGGSSGSSSQSSNGKAARTASAQSNGKAENGGADRSEAKGGSSSSSSSGGGSSSGSTDRDNGGGAVTEQSKAPASSPGAPEPAPPGDAADQQMLDFLLGP